MSISTTSDNITPHFIQNVDTSALEQKVKKMYKDVANRLQKAGAILDLSTAILRKKYYPDWKSRYES